MSGFEKPDEVADWCWVMRPRKRDRRQDERRAIAVARVERDAFREMQREAQR